MKLSRKLLAVMLSALMLVSLFTTALTVAAAQKETVIIAGSDYQTNDGTAHIELIMDAMKKDGIQPDKLFFGGDYSLEHSHETSTKGITQLKNYFSSILNEKDMVFAQGNHDPETTGGLAGWGNLDPAYGDYGLYIVEDPTLAQEWGSYDAASVAALQLYLDKKIEIGFSKPIFIMNHFPLHWSYRTQKDGVGTNAYRFFNVINDAAGKGLNIIYLFGHNHSNGYDDSMGGSCIFLKKGDTIEVAQGSKTTVKQETLNFTYMNSGYTGYYTSPMDTAEDTLTMSVFRIRGNEVIISRYSKDGAHNLKAAGVANTNFTYDVMPTVNDTVYSDTYKIAADGSATAVETVRDMGNDNGVLNDEVKTSTTEETKTGNGLAFRFTINATGVTVNNKNEFVNDNAQVKALGDNTNYKLVKMGAIVTNKANVGSDGSSFYPNKVDNDRIINVEAKYLMEYDETSATFAVRIINIPDDHKDTAIYARPYYVFEKDGNEITVYGDVTAATYNGKLSSNDGEMEW